MDSEEILKKHFENIKTFIQEYLKNEHDIALGKFEINALMNEMSKHLEPYYYNRGLFDAAAILAKQMDNISESILMLEKV